MSILTNSANGKSIRVMQIGVDHDGEGTDGIDHGGIQLLLIMRV